MRSMQSFKSRFIYVVILKFNRKRIFNASLKFRLRLNEIYDAFLLNSN